jgi:hypothetical protein
MFLQPLSVVVQEGAVVMSRLLQVLQQSPVVL